MPKIKTQKLKRDEKRDYLQVNDNPTDSRPHQWQWVSKDNEKMTSKC